jgi:hypothetical protein
MVRGQLLAKSLHLATQREDMGDKAAGKAGRVNGLGAGVLARVIPRSLHEVVGRRMSDVRVVRHLDAFGPVLWLLKA